MVAKLVATGGALALLLAAGGAQAQQQLVISTWGFNGDVLEEHLYKPFEEAHNVDIVLETGNNADRMSRLRIGGGGIDLIYLADAFTQEAIEAGLLATIDRSKIPNIERLYPIARAPHGEDYGPAYTVGRYGIIYDAAQVATPVTRWTDLWRDEFEGHLTIPDMSTTAGQLIVLAAAERAGVDAFQQPDAAFAELAALSDNLLTTYRRGSEVVSLFVQGEVTIGAAQDFVMGSVRDAVRGATWAELEGGAFANLNTINVVAGSEQADLAHAFINWQLDPGVQKMLAITGVGAPVNADVALSEQEAANWTYGQAVVEALRLPDYALLNGVRGDWTKRWNELFANR